MKMSFFQVLLDPIYTLCMVPPDDGVYAFEPFIEDNLAEHEDCEYVLNFIATLRIPTLANLIGEESADVTFVSNMKHLSVNSSPEQHNK